MGEVEVEFYIILTFSIHGAERLASRIDRLIPQETAPDANRPGDCVDGLNVLDKKKSFPPTRNRSVFLGFHLLD
jgi:hypothetical protein